MKAHYKNREHIISVLHTHNSFYWQQAYKNGNGIDFLTTFLCLIILACVRFQLHLILEG